MTENHEAYVRFAEVQKSYDGDTWWSRTSTSTSPRVSS